ncbi:hypothetical protein MMC14_000033 [Varicellaria rhodocarpa]|nr:hypothetical protein [Varicellaria rhodocarpa]
MPLPILSSFIDRLELIADLRKDYHIVRDEIAGDERNHHVRESMEARHQKRELYMTKKERGVRTTEDIEATRIAVNKAVQNLAKSVPQSRAFPILSGVLDKLEVIVEAREKARTGRKSRPSPQRRELLQRVLLVLGVNGGSGPKGKTKKTKKITKKSRGRVEEYHQEDDEDHIRGNTILSEILEVTQPPTERRPTLPDPDHSNHSHPRDVSPPERNHPDVAAAAANQLRDARLAIPGGMPTPSVRAATMPSHQEPTAASDEPVPPNHPAQAASPEETHPDAAAAETFLRDAALAESGGTSAAFSQVGMAPLHRDFAATGKDEHGPPDGQGDDNSAAHTPPAHDSAHGSGAGGHGEESGSSASSGGSSRSSGSEGEISDLETHTGHVQGTRGTRERGRERSREGGNGS